MNISITRELRTRVWRKDSQILKECEQALQGKKLELKMTCKRRPDGRRKSDKKSEPGFMPFITFVM